VSGAGCWTRSWCVREPARRGPAVHRRRPDRGG
jgi:hypothetical protein